MKIRSNQFLCRNNLLSKFETDKNLRPNLIFFNMYVKLRIVSVVNQKLLLVQLKIPVVEFSSVQGVQPVLFSFRENHVIANAGLEAVQYCSATAALPIVYPTRRSWLCETFSHLLKQRNNIIVSKHESGCLNRFPYKRSFVVSLRSALQIRFVRKTAT